LIDKLLVMWPGASRAIFDPRRHHHEVTAAVGVVKWAKAKFADDVSLDVVTLVTDRARLKVAV
jgi:hypothetical protein